MYIYMYDHICFDIFSWRQAGQQRGGGQWRGYCIFIDIFYIHTHYIYKFRYIYTVHICICIYTYFFISVYVYMIMYTLIHAIISLCIHVLYDFMYILICI